MRFPLDVTLFDRQSPEDAELQVSWNVTVWVTVDATTPSEATPGIEDVDNIVIEDVSAVFLQYGESGQACYPIGQFTVSEARETRQTIDWLNRQLRERDYWIEKIERLAKVAAAELRLPPLHPNYFICT